MENEFEIFGISRAMLNGRNVKIARIYKFTEPNIWEFVNNFDVPVKIADKNIISYLKEQDRL